MLIIVSDMHLTDQTLAPSVPLKALEQFMVEVKRIADKAKSVEIVLLSDIFDVLRSSHWLVKISGANLMYVPVDIRPWHAVDTPIERIVSTILSDIKKSYSTFFEEIRRLDNVKLSWVPGNHDRLIKITDAGKQFLNDIGVQLADYEILRRDYGVFARHGHCFDDFNIRDGNYELAPVGDGIVIEILNNLQIEVAKKRRIVNFNHPDIAFLGAMEYVRPYTQVPIWIHKKTETLQDELLRNRTREAWRNVVDNFQKSEILELLPTFQRKLFLELLEKSKNFRNPIIALLGIFEKIVEQPEKYIEKASTESALSDPSIQHVVYGHTHVPQRHRLKNNKYYVNTGWWKRSYMPPDLERMPFMHDFYILIIDKGGGEPDLKQITINLSITWKPPYMTAISPAVSFERAQEVETSIAKEAMLEKGLIDLFTDAPGIKVNALANSRKQGFDMVITNKVRPATLGSKIAVGVKHEIKMTDIVRLADNI